MEDTKIKVIKPSYEIVNEPNWDEVLIALEKAIRTCYKSEKKIDAGTADKLIRSIIERGHESTLEHQMMTVRFIADRGFLAEITRHRHCSFSVESTRYVGYSKDAKNYKGLTEYILPCWLDDKLVGEWSGARLLREPYHLESPDADDAATRWVNACMIAQASYDDLIRYDWKPEQARSVLPNSLKTEIVISTNFRDWRHLLGLRTSKYAHPQMRELMVPLLDELKKKCPTLFDSVIVND